MSDDKEKSEKKFGGVVPPKPLIKETELLIDPDLVRPLHRKKKDAIDLELDAEDENEAKELRQLRVEEIRQRRLARIRKLEKEGQPDTPISMQRDASGMWVRAMMDPTVQKHWLSLSEEDRAVILSAAQAFNGDGIDPQLRLLLTQRTSPSNALTLKDVVELMTVMQNTRTKDVSTLDAVKVGVEMTKEKSKPDLVGDIFVNLIKPLYENQIKDLKNQPTVPEQLQYIKGVATELGLQPVAAANAANIEITKMQLDQERWKVEQEWKMETWREEVKLKQMTEEKRYDTIAKIATSWMDRASPLIDGVINAGKQRLERPSSTSHPSASSASTSVAVSAPAPEMNEVPCPKCHTAIKVIGIPESITCPVCSTVLSRRIEPANSEGEGESINENSETTDRPRVIG